MEIDLQKEFNLNQREMQQMAQLMEKKKTNMTQEEKMRLLNKLGNSLNSKVEKKDFDKLTEEEKQKEREI